MKSYNTADEFFENNELWNEELLVLRTIVLESGLEETTKWGGPTYTYNGKNLVGMAGFKSYFGIWFYQGALLKDKAKLLVSGNEGSTKALRQMRMYDAKDINRKTILAYIKESIKNFDDGVEIKPEKNKPLLIPDALNKAFKENKELKLHFDKLNLTKKRDFAEYIQTAKQDKTKLSRLEKIVPMIINGIGLHDKYK